MSGSVGCLGTMACLTAHLLLCGACSNRWAFALPDELIAKAPSLASDPFIAHRKAPHSALPEQPVRLPRMSEQEARHVIPASYTARVIPAGNVWQAPSFEPTTSMLPGRVPRNRGRLRRRFLEANYKILADHRDYYSLPNIRDLLLGVSAAGVFANTSMDQDIRDWYQDDVRDSGLDDCAAFCKVFGDGKIFVSSFAAMALAEGIIDLEEGEPGYHVGVFSDRVTRAYLVGAPPLLFMQACLGGSRPGETLHESRWRPFEDNNGVSGHGFVGAVPFLTAGRMIEQKHPRVAGCLYFCSALPAWSRVNDDAHYFSQACLGWWMAYLACRSVDHTESEYRNLTFTPLAMNNTVGVRAVYRR